MSKQTAGSVDSQQEIDISQIEEMRRQILQKLDQQLEKLNRIDREYEDRHGSTCRYGVFTDPKYGSI